MYSTNPYDQKHETALKAQSGTEQAVKNDLNREVADKIDTKQLAQEASGGIKSLSATSGMPVGQVIDRARGILEKEAASRGIKLTHADLDRFEASLKGIMAEGQEKTENKFNNKNEPALSADSVATPLAQIQKNATQFANSAIFGNSEAEANSSGVKQAWPSVDQIISGMQAGQKNQITQPQALAIENNIPNLNSIDNLLKRQLSALLMQAVEAPLSQTIARGEDTLTQKSLAAKRGAWVISSSNAHHGSFAVYLNNLAKEQAA